MSSRWTGFFIWALVAASTAFWGIRIFAATRPVPLGAQAPMAAIPPAGPMERLFGAVVVPTAQVAPSHPESERFQLVGVIASRNDADPKSGLAIVTIDGQPARPWHVGATLDGNTTLLAVAKRTADFGPVGGPATFTLQLPEPAAAETGTLQTAVSQPDGLQQQPASQRETAQHVAQPVPPGLMQQQRGMNRAVGRGMQPAQMPAMPPMGAVPPARVAPTPGLAPQGQANDGGSAKPDGE